MAVANNVIDAYESIIKTIKIPDGWLELKANKAMFKTFDVDFTQFKNDISSAFKNSRILFSVSTNAETKKLIDRIKYSGNFQRLLVSNKFIMANYRGINVAYGTVPFGEILLVSPLDVDNLLKMK